MVKRVAVVGAGVSGLTAIKCLLDEGLEPVCLERGSYIGGLWQYTEDVEAGQSCVNKSTIINTSKEMMSFSDFLIPKEFPNFMHNTKVMQYFHMYADHFGLKKHIRFHTEVLRVAKAEDFEASGRWVLDVKDRNTGEVSKETFDALMICTGHHAQCHMPKFRGEESFKGKRMHTQHYKHPGGYEGKRVVVVGIGNSGGDVAVELARTCDTVFLSTRRGAWVATRLGDKGIPVDMIVNRRIMLNIASYLPRSTIDSAVEAKINQNFDHELYGLRPKHRFTAQHPMVNESLPDRIASGTVVVKPNITRITETGVEFDDGTFEDNIDVIIYGTGYKFGFPFLEPGVVDVKENKADLYKFCFPPDLQPSSLMIVGVVQPIGALMPIAELQCRWAAKVFKGELSLPSHEAMWAEIREKRERMASRYVQTQRHTIQVDWVPFMDELAEQVRCKPNLGKLFLTDPRLAWVVLTGPVTPYQYRLTGPGTWAGARDAILTQWDRCYYPLQTRKTGVPRTAGGGAASTLIRLAVLVAIIAFIYKLLC